MIIINEKLLTSINFKSILILIYNLMGRMFGAVNINNLIKYKIL